MFEFKKNADSSFLCVAIVHDKAVESKNFEKSIIN